MSNQELKAAAIAAIQAYAGDMSVSLDETHDGLCEIAAIANNQVDATFESIQMRDGGGDDD